MARRSLLVVTAYILVQTEVGKAAEVAREIVGIEGVEQAEDVTGPYDVIVRAEAHNIDELGQLVVARVQAVDAAPGPSPVRSSASKSFLHRNLMVSS
jgi:DNA-binding Lrp family transcriptional regulator